MFRTLAATGAASVLVLVGLVGVANAEDGHDCSDFGTQEQAQAAFDGMNRPADRMGLDPDGDGIVCEDLPSALDPGVDHRIDTGGGAMAARRQMDR